MNRRANLTKLVKIGNNWTYRKPVYTKKTGMLTNRVRHNGKDAELGGFAGRGTPRVEGSEVRESNLGSILSQCQAATALQVPSTGKQKLHRLWQPSLQGCGSSARVDVFEIDEFPLLLNQAPLARISALRGSPSFLSLLDTLASTTDEEVRVRTTPDLLNLISAEFAKEPRGLGKLTRLRLRVFFPPRDLSEELAAAGISLSDVVAFASKVGGFMLGETVGWLVGIFGIGGALGTGAAMMVEQVARRAYEKPRKQREFQQVLQLLASATRPKKIA